MRASRAPANPVTVFAPRTADHWRVTVYLAFVRRTGARRYSATFPDLDGLVVHARGPRHLPNAAVVRARQAGFGRVAAPPPATALRDLPRLHDDADGYWLAVDLADALPGAAEAMAEDGAAAVAPADKPDAGSPGAAHCAKAARGFDAVAHRSPAVDAAPHRHAVRGAHTPTVTDGVTGVDADADAETADA